MTQRPNQRRIGNQYSAASASATNRMAATGISSALTKAPFVPADTQSRNGNHAAPCRSHVSLWEILPTGAEFPAAFAIGYACNVVEPLRSGLNERSESTGIRYAFEAGMRFVLAFLLVAHGVAHLVGFVSSWKLATLAELPYKTAVFSGRVDVGDAGIRVMGVLWLLAALAFLVAAFAVATETGWAVRFTLAAVIASLLLCVVGWPDARIGVAVNVGLALLLAIGARLNLAVLTP